MLKVRSDYIYYGTEWSKIYINLCYIVSAENCQRTVQILLNCNEVLEKKGDESGTKNLFDPAIISTTVSWIINSSRVKLLMKKGWNGKGREATGFNLA